MRGRRTISRCAAAVEFVPRDYFAPLDLRQLFPREAPLEVDVGCGDGAYLATIAEQSPERNFLGLERLAGRVRSACNKIAQRQLENARVLLIDASYAVEYLFPARSVAAFHILFPDPWPKRRHQRRRVLDDAFFDALKGALAPGGLVRFATDQRDYFDHVHEIARRKFTIKKPDNEVARSTFQRRFEEVGAPIYRLVLRNTSGCR